MLKNEDGGGGLNTVGAMANAAMKSGGMGGEAMKMCLKCVESGAKLSVVKPGVVMNSTSQEMRGSQYASTVNMINASEVPALIDNHVPRGVYMNAVPLPKPTHQVAVIKRRRGGPGRGHTGPIPVRDEGVESQGKEQYIEVADMEWQAGGRGPKMKRPKVQTNPTSGRGRGRGRGNGGVRITSVDPEEFQAAEGMLGIIRVQSEDVGFARGIDRDATQASTLYKGSSGNHKDLSAISNRHEGGVESLNCTPLVPEAARLLLGEEDPSFSDGIQPQSTGGTSIEPGKNGNGQESTDHDTVVGQPLVGTGTKSCRRCHCRKPVSEFVEPRRRGWYTCNTCSELKRRAKHPPSAAFRSVPSAPGLHPPDKKQKPIKFDYDCSLPDVKRTNQRWKKLSQILEQLSDSNHKLGNFSTVPQVPITPTVETEPKNDATTVPDVDTDQMEKEESSNGTTSRDSSSDGSQDSVRSDEFLKCEECKEVKPCEAFKPEGSLSCADCRYQRGKASQFTNLSKPAGVPYGVHTHITPLVICDESSALDSMKHKGTKESMPTMANGYTIGESSQEDTGDYEKLLEMKSCNTPEPNMTMSPGCFFPALQPSNGHQPAILNPPCLRTPPLELEGLSASGMRSNRRKSRKGRTPVQNGHYKKLDKIQNYDRRPSVQITGKSIRVSSVNPWCLPKHAGEKAALFRDVDLEACLSSVGLIGLVEFLLS